MPTLTFSYRLLLSFGSAGFCPLVLVCRAANHYFYWQYPGIAFSLEYHFLKMSLFQKLLRNSIYARPGLVLLNCGII
jgi:hypothetical protein